MDEVSADILGKRLLAKLGARQGRLTDRAYAIQLGIPRSTWALTRLGHLPLGRRVAFAVRRAFPDLAKEAERVLLTETRARRGGDAPAPRHRD